MKKSLVFLALILGGIFSSCNKEIDYGNMDLNGDGKPENVLSRRTPYGFCTYFFNDNFLDTNYILKNLSTPANTLHFFDFNGDGFPDAKYKRWSYVDEKLNDYWVENEEGVFGEEKKIKMKE